LLAIGTVYVQVADFAASGPIAIAGTRTDQKVVALTFDHSWAIIHALHPRHPAAAQPQSHLLIMAPGGQIPRVAKRWRPTPRNRQPRLPAQNYGDMPPDG
jgi:hypothetical protein